VKELVPAALPLEFLDLIMVKNGSPIPSSSMINARIALGLLGCECRYDVFHDRYLIEGTAFGNSATQVSDPVIGKLRETIRLIYKFDPGKNNMWDAVNRACEDRSFHPVVDYLDGLVWDGKPRIEKMFSTYFRAEDTPFNRGVARLLMVAAVRRIREPGAKFDCMVVLESPEGYGKSSALAELFGRENFSDQTILGVQDKELQEALRGRWCIEVPELVGLKRADIEKVKAAITRETDRARPAYGRATVDVARSMVLIGTTNDETYLRALSGENRRFLPVRVGRVDFKALLRDRNQLWAEASSEETWGDPLTLPQALWQDASDQRASRTQIDPWADVLADVADQAERAQMAFVSDGDEPAAAIFDAVLGEHRVSSEYVLGTALGLTVERRTPDQAKRAASVMRSLGWTGKFVRIKGEPMRGYARPAPLEPWE